MGGNRIGGVENRLYVGDIVEVGHLYLNDTDLGILWKKPFSADISDALKPGLNQLRLEVANTWANLRKLAPRERIFSSRASGPKGFQSNQRRRLRNRRKTVTRNLKTA